MRTSVIFDRTMIAPCGMNCGSCIAYLRDKNKCSGCPAGNPSVWIYEISLSTGNLRLIQIDSEIANDYNTDNENEIKIS